ncbi:hypothetical protein LguiA_026116 [Lonicera macranthoides]
MSEKKKKLLSTALICIIDIFLSFEPSSRSTQHTHNFQALVFLFSLISLSLSRKL